MGTATLAPRRVLEKQYGQEFMSAFGRGVAHISKARVGLMTIQIATTVRNTTNGYMRNYIEKGDLFKELTDIKKIKKSTTV